jgi:hypothetical protein
VEAIKRPSKNLGIAVTVVGVALALFSGFAETLGIGGGTFGWKQVVGVVVGCIVTVVGLAIVFGLSSTPPDSQN